MSAVDVDLLIRRRSTRRWWLVLAVVAAVAVAGAAAFVLLQPEEPEVVAEPQRAEAVTGQLSTTAELTGSAVSERSATLTFETAGVVVGVSVEAGDTVRVGDALATLDDSDAQRRVATAEVQLRLAQLRLEALLADPDAPDLAAALQSIESAQSQVLSAELALARILEPAGAGELASAEQAVSNALGQLSSAEEALVQLSAPPGAGELASAEQAVASALGQLSSAEGALMQLSAPAGAAELASAEQALANALGQLSSAEEALVQLSAPAGAAELASVEQAIANALGQLSNTEAALARLLEPPDEAEVAAAQSSLTQTQAQLTSATNRVGASWDVLREAFDDYCGVYEHLNEVVEGTCAAELPFTDDQIAVVRDSLEGRSSTYQRYANGLINGSVAFVEADAARVSSVSAVGSAEARLDELLTPASADDRYQAEQAVDAAKASHTAAVARLDDLQAEPDEDDLFQAEQTVEAARASHAAAVARLDDLQAEPDEDDLFQAEQAVDAARSNHAAAVARLDDLQAEPGEEDVFQAEQAVDAARSNHAAAVARLADLRAAPDEDEVGQARAALESARASLTTAQARYDALLAGTDGNAIAQQQLSVRLAEISLDEARAALDGLAAYAPFDGVVEAVNVAPGDRVSASLGAFSLGTPDSMLIELTVTEADLLELEVGQAGLATFDAIDGAQYPLRIESIGRVPNTAQGVVTYEVKARLLVGPEVAEVADQIAVLDGAFSLPSLDALLGAGGGAAGVGAGGGATGAGAGRGAAGVGAGGGATGAGAGRGAPGGGARGGPAGILAGLELPEGVTIQQVLQAIASDEPLPEGVTLPEDLTIPPQVLERLRGAFRDGAGEQAAPGRSGAFASQPVPAPGMTASVTILTELREPSVLVPVAAVRQLDGAWFVAIPVEAAEPGGVTFERVTVEVGASDGVSVEITSGLDAGAVVLIGADSAGVAFTATQQPQQLPGSSLPGGGFGGGRP